MPQCRRRSVQCAHQRRIPQRTHHVNLLPLVISARIERAGILIVARFASVHQKLGAITGAQR